MKNIHPWVQGARSSADGFTILEMMITVAVLGILIGIAVPSFRDIIRQNRVTSQTNELLAAAAMARSEAVKRGINVSICPVVSAANPSECADDDTWSNGWIVFTDDEGTVGTVDADGTLPDDTIIERWPASTPLHITITNAETNFLTYKRSGATTLGFGIESTFTIAPEECEDQGAREVVVAHTGRVSSSRVTCP